MADSITSFKTEEGLKQLNTLLETRSYVAGDFNPTKEDFDYLAKISQNVCPDTFPHARRWFQHIKALKAAYPLKKWSPAGGAAGPKAGTSAPKGGKGADEANMDGLLKGAVVGKVCTRFPPEPSGYLHIGHAKAAMLNNYYAREYKGKLILRFDDTNPSKEKQEFQEAIVKDLATLQIFPDQVTHTSDYFPHLEKCMEGMIKKGVAYVDDTDVLQMREERDKGTCSKRRDQSVQENLRMWAEMLKGSPEGDKCCVRGKMDMTNPNKCLRDPVFYRCKLDVPHHRTGTKYKAYPTYDLACPVVDALEGITHCLRTIEYKDRLEQYQWVQDNAPGCHRVEVVEYSKTQFTYTILSKRKLTMFVDKGYVEGWDDPRFPTVRGVIKRGMTVEALQEFVKTQGMSKATNLMEWDKIWAINKQHIDPIVPRYASISEQGAVTFKLQNGPSEPLGKMDKKHPKNPDMGDRLILQYKEVYLEQEDSADITEGEEVTLLHWGNAIVDKIVKDPKTNEITEMIGRTNPDGDVKKTKKKIHWVPKLPEQVTPCLLRELDHLVTKAKIEDDDNVEEIINPCSLIDTPAIGDPMLKTLKKGTKIQFERRGYFIVDKAFFTPGAPGPMVLIKIPDGKSKDMGVKSKVDPKALQGQGSKETKKVAEKAAAEKAAPPAAPKPAEPAKDAKPAKGKAKAAPAKAADRPLDDISRLNIKVGKIIEVWPHPEAEKLYCEKIDLGEGEPRTIASGLRPFLTEKEMLGQMVIVLANLKPRNMKGFASQGMVLCSSNADKSKVELMQPPADAKIGERVIIEGVEMLEADDKLNEKEGKAPWPVLAEGCKCVGKEAAYKGAKWKTSAGNIVCKTISDGTIS